VISRRELIISAGASLLRPDKPKRIAAIVTAYHQNSHADLLVGRLFQTETLDGKGRKPQIELAGLYVDQFPSSDKSRALAKQYGFPIYPTPQEALTLGGQKLAVDGVMIIGEHGSYPTNDRGQELYPRKRFFDAVVDVFRRSGQTAPVFMDKHLSHDWKEAAEIYQTSRKMGFALMAGSSVPGTWRRPALDVKAGATLEEIVAVSFHTLYGYGFHALEMVQCLAEMRAGGETGVRGVQCLEGDAVWRARKFGRFDGAIMNAALEKLSKGKPKDLEASVPTPVAFIWEYMDGLRASVLTLNPAVGEWTAAWLEKGDPDAKAALFWTQEARPFGHFTFLFRGMERMMLTGKPSWPVERTLLTTGLMDRLLFSKSLGGRPLDTPELAIRYKPEGRWKQPPDPPPGRPLDGA
jgi:hypothetical protein